MRTTPSATIDTLTFIWEQVLQRSSISVEEDFFDLGGTSKLADALFSQIALTFGWEFPSTTIACAPTIAELAALLDRSASPVLSHFIPLRSGSERPPVFIVHGLSGTAEFFEIARHIETKHAIWGIQAKGIDGLEAPLERVEDMAALYLASIGEIEPDGPYLLIGYSFGGLIALEMAQRLLANGKRVALLTMLDTYPHPRYLPVTERLRLLGKRVEYHVGEMRRLPFPGPLTYVVNKARKRLGISGNSQQTGSRDAECGGEVRPTDFASSRIMQKGLLAMARYRPQPYRGEIKHIVAGTTSFYLPRNPVAIWGHLAAKLEVDTIPGDHVEIVRSRCEALYPILTRHVEGAAPSGMRQSRSIHGEGSRQSSSRGVHDAGAGHDLTPASNT